eukprot:gene26658-30127_t
MFKHVKKCQTASQIVQSAQQTPASEQNVIRYLYVVGGRQRGRTLGSVERFSFSTQKWEDCPHMLEQRGSHGAASINGVLYAIGGGGFRSNLSSCEQYDGKEWKLAAPLGVSRHALAVVEANNDNVYAVGGWIDGKECSPVVERFNAVSNTWTTVAPLVQARRLHGVAAFPAPTEANTDGKVADDRLFAFGGNCDHPHWHTNSAEFYDPITNEWRVIASMPAAGGAAAATVFPFLFVFLHGKYVLRYDPVTDEYLRLSDLPLPDWNCFDVVTVPNTTHILVHGGVTNGRWCNDMYQYDAAKDEWTKMPSMRTARRRCASAIVTLPMSSTTENVTEVSDAKKQKTDL